MNQLIFLSMPGVPAALRRLARLGTSDPEFDQSCEGGRWHGRVDAQVGRSMKTFDAHQAPTLGQLLDALADTIEDERRRFRRRHR
jgi:hypothetical protein